MYTITPLWLGLMKDYDLSGHLFNTDCGVKMDCPYIGWLVRGDGKNILVDTGPCGTDHIKKYHSGITAEIRPEDHILKVLEREGLQPGDISYIINTHLHWDHCHGNRYFPNTTFYVQRSEVYYALDPLPLSRFTYEAPSAGLTPPWIATINAMVMVDGDKQIDDGISLLHTPGHTPGSQCVAVDTEAGLHLICGDCINLYRNWIGNPDRTKIVPGIHVNVADCYASYEKLEKISPVYILPGHEPEVFRYKRYPVVN